MAINLSNAGWEVNRKKKRYSYKNTSQKTQVEVSRRGWRYSVHEKKKEKKKRRQKYSKEGETSFLSAAFIASITHEVQLIFAAPVPKSRKINMKRQTRNGNHLYRIVCWKFRLYRTSDQFQFQFIWIFEWNTTEHFEQFCRKSHYFAGMTSPYSEWRRAEYESASLPAIPVKKLASLGSEVEFEAVNPDSSFLPLSLSYLRGELIQFFYKVGWDSGFSAAGRPGVSI